MKLNKFNKNFILNKNKNKSKNCFVNSKFKFRLNIFNEINSSIVFKSMSVSVGLKKFFNGAYYNIMKNTNGFIFLIKNSNGSYLGDYYKNFFFPSKLLKNIFLGSQTFLACLPIYSIVSNVYNILNKKSIYAKSNGSYAQILESKNSFNIVLLKLPSGIKKFLFSTSICILGRNSNINQKYITFGKASFFKILGKNPSVRGVAKNPVDHPHGGRTKTVKPEVSP